MCGNTLITKQSGAAGLPCNCVYIVEKLSIKKEYYLSLALDRKAGCPVFIYSPAGGMSIEEVARKNPEKIFKMPVDIKKELDIEKLFDVANKLGLADNKSQITYLFRNLLDCFLDKDCDLIEINPLVLLNNGQICAADSKITIDDNAVFR